MVVPDATPVRKPDPDHMVATPVALLNHTPPAVASVIVMEDPAHTVNVPPIAAGFGFTVNTAVPVQPPGKV